MFTKNKKYEDSPIVASEAVASNPNTSQKVLEKLEVYEKWYVKVMWQKLRRDALEKMKTSL
jgi:hypothetical protein